MPAVIGRIQTVDSSLPVNQQVNIPFLVAGEDMTSTVQASYNSMGKGTLSKSIFEKISELTGWTEFAERYTGITPKVISFPITWYAEATGKGTIRNPTLSRIEEYIRKLEALCYPRRVVGGNPPLVKLTIGGLYRCVEVLITNVSVVHAGIWKLDDGLPLLYKISISCQLFSYPTFERVVAGVLYEGDGAHYTGDPE